MKRNLLLAVVGLFSFCTCTHDEDALVGVENGRESEIITSNKRTFEEAIAVAKDAVAMLGDTQTRAIGRNIDFSKNCYIMGNTQTRGGVNDTLMYIFNYEDAQGYAVVSASKETEPLLAVTVQGTYTEDSESENDGLALYMDAARGYVAASFEKPTLKDSLLIGGGDGSVVITEQKTETIKDTIVYGPFLDVKWGQGSPYNDECIINDSLCPTGCVATALAQIMSYYEFPSSLLIFYEDYSLYYLNLDWDELKKHTFTSYYSDVCSSDNHANLAVLFRQIGKGVEMDYTPNSSGSNINKAAAYIKNIGYSATITDFDQEAVNSELKANRIMYIQGIDIGDVDNKNDDVGHAWVLDGLFHIKTTIKSYIRPSGQLDWTLTRTSVVNTYYNHFNWGYDGLNNGYFLSNVFNLEKYYSLDEGSYGWATGDYSTDVQLIINISPEE